MLCKCKETNFLSTRAVVEELLDASPVFVIDPLQ